MRVISGIYKGRKLSTVNNLSVRPATDRVKQTLFDMLMTRIEMDGISVLDLFAGSGGLGIEALSRGAGRVAFVESSEEAMNFIEQNLKLLGCLLQADIYETDALSFVERSSASYDLVFADPPYRFEQTPEIPSLIFQRGLVKPGGYLLIEHESSLKFESSELYHAGPAKKFGRTIVTFFRNRSNEESDTPSEETTSS